MANREEQLINDIEMILTSDWGRLGALPEEEQKTILQEEQAIFTKIIEDITTHRVPSLQLDGVKSSLERSISRTRAEHDHLVSYGDGVYVGGPILNAATSASRLLGFNRPTSMSYERCDPKDARLADSAYSESNLYSALMKAGEMFEQTNSRYLNERSHQFREEITSVDRADFLAKSIITACRTLSAVRNGRVLRLLLNINDVKIMAKDTFNRIFSSSSITESFQDTQSEPIISENQFAWVKYKFSRECSNESGLVVNKKICNLNLTIKHYCFPDEAAFRAAFQAALSEAKTKQRERLADN